MRSLVMNSTRVERRPKIGHAGPDPRTYALGYSQSEFSRLEQQGTFFAGLTEDVLRRAGLSPGMRVLDIGCGVGDVSLLAAWMVGPSGAVLGIDRSADAIATAQRRAAAAAQDNVVRFAAAEIDTLTPGEAFDAVIGRLILMYLPDPAATLRRLRRQLCPGGIMAFQEMMMTMGRSIPEGPPFHQCVNWILDTFERAGIELDMGGKLFATFLAAGLPAPQIWTRRRFSPYRVNSKDSWNRTPATPGSRSGPVTSSMSRAAPGMRSAIGHRSRR
jgi:SAM-dependent methyltransferase